VRRSKINLSRLGENDRTTRNKDHFTLNTATFSPRQAPVFFTYSDKASSVGAIGLKSFSEH